VRSKSINFAQYIHTIQSAQAVGNWPVNVLSQKLASGEYLEGQAYEDCIDNCTTTAPFMEEVPPEGDIVSCLCQYYQRRIVQCVVIGKPPPTEVLGEMFSDVVWDEGASAESAHSKYRAMKRLMLKQANHDPDRLKDQLSRQTRLTNRGQAWWRKVEALLKTQKTITRSMGKKWEFTYPVLDTAVDTIFHEEATEEGLVATSKPRSRSSHYSHALITDVEGEARNAPSIHRGREGEARNAPSMHGRDRTPSPYGMRGGFNRYSHTRSHSPGYNRFDRRVNSCDRCGCHHTEEAGDQCPFRPMNGPAEFKGWSAQYIAELPTRQAGAIRYRIAEVQRGHDAHLDPEQRKALWKKVEELRGQRT